MTNSGEIPANGLMYDCLTSNLVGNMTVTPTVVAASGDLSLMITSTSEDSAYTG